MKIKYEFATGTEEIDVEKKWADVLLDFDRLERNNQKTETRRHYSLDAITYEGEEYGAEDEYINALFKDTDKIDRLNAAVSHLSEKQKELVKAIYYDKIPAVEYANKTGVTKGAISQQLTTIKNKLKKFF